MSGARYSVLPCLTSVARAAGRSGHQSSIVELRSPAARLARGNLPRVRCERVFISKRTKLQTSKRVKSSEPQTRQATETNSNGVRRCNTRYVRRDASRVHAGRRRASPWRLCSSVFCLHPCMALCSRRKSASPSLQQDIVNSRLQQRTLHSALVWSTERLCVAAVTSRTDDSLTATTSPARGASVRLHLLWESLLHSFHFFHLYFHLTTPTSYSIHFFFEDR